MAILGKKVKVRFQRQEIVLQSGIIIEPYVDLTDYVYDVEIGKPMARFAIRKIHAPLLDIAKVHQSILATNPAWIRAVDDNSLFYAVVVECENKPEAIGNIEWIELKEL